MREVKVAGRKDTGACGRWRSSLTTSAKRRGWHRSKKPGRHHHSLPAHLKHRAERLLRDWHHAWRQQRNKHPHVQMAEQIGLNVEQPTHPIGFSEDIKARHQNVR